MTGVWVFNKAVLRRETPGVSESSTSKARRKVLVHVPANEVITSNEMLEQKLMPLGWERYLTGNPSLLQFHQRTSVHLITVPIDFARMSTVHMYDIVVKTRNIFEVRDA